MSQKVSAEVFGKLSRLKSGDCIRFNLSTSGAPEKGVAVVLSGSAAGSMVLSEISDSPSHQTAGLNPWRLCSFNGLAYRGFKGEAVLEWDVESIEVSPGECLDQAHKYEQLLKRMDGLREDTRRVCEHLKLDVKSAPFVYAYQALSDMETAHYGTEVTTASLAAWLADILPEYPKDVQALILVMTLSAYSKDGELDILSDKPNLEGFGVNTTRAQ